MLLFPTLVCAVSYTLVLVHTKPYRLGLVNMGSSIFDFESSRQVHSSAVRWVDCVVYLSIPHPVFRYYFILAADRFAKYGYVMLYSVAAWHKHCVRFFILASRVYERMIIIFSRFVICNIEEKRFHTHKSCHNNKARYCSSLSVGSWVFSFLFSTNKSSRK